MIDTELYEAKELYPFQAKTVHSIIEELEKKVNESTSDKIGWLDGMRIIGSHVYKNNLKRFELFKKILIACKNCD